MIARFFIVLFAALSAVSHAARAQPELTSAPVPDADGFITLFNGRDLTGWTGLADYWSVEDGAIRGHQIKETSRQTFLILSTLTVKDFELHFRYRFASPDGNSGVQFLSLIHI